MSTIRGFLGGQQTKWYPQPTRCNLSDKNMANYHVRCKSPFLTCCFPSLQNKSSSETIQMNSIKMLINHYHFNGFTNGFGFKKEAKTNSKTGMIRKGIMIFDHGASKKPKNPFPEWTHGLGREFYLG